MKCIFCDKELEKVEFKNVIVFDCPTDGVQGIEASFFIGPKECEAIVKDYLESKEG